MTSTTHTEIYRRFRGTLEPARLRFVPLWRARVRVGLKRKLPLLLFYVPPWISGIVFSFIVYTKFTLEQGTGAPWALAPGASAVSTMAGQMIQVHDQIVLFTHVSRFFALLAIAWFGAGLICEDQRAGAQLLYFSRPITTLDYFLAHFFTAITFGCGAVLLPALLICLVAVFNSPDYAFLTEKWDVIAGAIAYSIAFVVTVSLIVLAVSSVSARKTYALAGVFAVMLGSEAIGGVLSALHRDRDWFLVSIPGNLRKLADWLLSANQTRWDWNPWYSVAVLGGVSVLSLLVIAWRLRRLEVVA